MKITHKNYGKRNSHLLSCIIFGLVICIQLNCKKNVPGAELPPATQEGKNTFGCKVSGNVWVANLECDFLQDPCNAVNVSIERAWADSALPVGVNMLFRNRTSGRRSSISIVNKNIQSPPMSYFKATGEIYDSVNIIYISDSGTFFSSPVGSLIINKLDTLNRIIVGTFSCTLQAGPDKSIVLTDGRFDMMFNVCSCIH